MQHSIRIYSRKKSCNVVFGVACFIMDFSDVTGVPPFNSRGSGLSVRGVYAGWMSTIGRRDIGQMSPIATCFASEGSNSLQFKRPARHPGEQEQCTDHPRANRRWGKLTFRRTPSLLRSVLPPLEVQSDEPIAQSLDHRHADARRLFRPI